MLNLIPAGGDSAASSGANSRSIAFVGLTVAIMAVSAWVTVPFGPIPFTLQTFAIVFAIVVLKPQEAVAAVAVYLLLGALGVPVFSGMRGGLGVVAGPTGGFLWGFLPATAIAAYLLAALHKGRGGMPAHQASAAASSGGRVRSGVRAAAAEFALGVLFCAVAYACGMVQYMAVAHVDAGVAFATCCAPFIVVDVAKVAAAVVVAQQVRRAVSR